MKDGAPQLALEVSCPVKAMPQGRGQPPLTAEGQGMPPVGSQASGPWAGGVSSPGWSPGAVYPGVLHSVRGIRQIAGLRGGVLASVGSWERRRPSAAVEPQTPEQKEPGLGGLSMGEKQAYRLTNSNSFYLTIKTQVRGDVRPKSCDNS